MKIRSFDVYRKGKKYEFFLHGVKVLALDKSHVQKNRGILDTTVDVLHQQLFPILKQIDENPSRFGELLAEFNGVKV